MYKARLRSTGEVVAVKVCPLHEPGSPSGPKDLKGLTLPLLTRLHVGPCHRQVQRPRCEEIISVDLYVLRWYAGLINKILGLLKRDIDVVAIIDDFGELIYR